MKEISDEIISKMLVLNDLEMQKSKIYSAIFKKNMNEIKIKKIQELRSDFENQAEFYNQYIEDYEEEYNEIERKYESNLSQIIEKYNELFINIYLELQEAECNHKIAIANIKNSYDIKCEILDKADEEIIQEYNKKIQACLEKKNNYDTIIAECEKELNNAISDLSKQINSIFGNKSGSLIIRDENFVQKLINKIKNLFTGKSSFKNYVLNPLKVELDLVEKKTFENIDYIQENIVNIVAKIRQAKKETNRIFEEML